MAPSPSAITPVVSVVIPVKGRVDLLPRTLESLCGQTLTHWEALVVDDDSPSSERAGIEEACRMDPRIRFHPRERSTAGAPACRNEGFEQSHAPLVVFLDSDDLLLPEALAERKAFMDDHPDLDYHTRQAWLFQETPGDLGLVFNIPRPDPDLERFLRFDCPWQTTGPTWRREALEKIGPWDETLRIGQDMDHSCRAILAGLRHVRLEIPDYHLRGWGNRRDSVGADAANPAKLPSHEQRIGKLREALESHGGLPSRLRHLLAGNYFWIAHQWCRQGHLTRGLSVWRKALSHRLVTRRMFGDALAFLVLSRTGGAWLLARRLVRSWPEECFIRNFQTTGFAPGTIGSKVCVPPEERLPGFRHVVRVGTLRYLRWRLRSAVA